MHNLWISKTDAALDREIESALEFLNWRNVIAPDVHVSIKPNLTFPIHRAGVTTSPAMLEGVVRALSSRTRNINVVESDGGSSAWTAEEAFSGHRVSEICRRYGARAINLSRWPRDVVETEIAGHSVAVELSQLLTRETDVFITMPVPKIHAMTGVSLGFKNQWGCLPDVKRLRHHWDFARAVLAINKILRPRLTIFDGTYFLDQNGPLEGNPIRKDLLIVSDDVGTGSLACCALMGINPSSIPHLRMAIAEKMMPSTLDAVVSNQPLGNFAGTSFKLRRTWSQRLTRMVFRSRLATIALYDSPLARPAHEVVYMLRGRPIDFSAKW